MNWDNENNSKIFDTECKYIESNCNYKSINLFNAVSKCYDSQDVDGYIALMNKFADLYLKNYAVDKAYVAFKKIIDVDEGNIDVR